jgi:hexosaminidase
MQKSKTMMRLVMLSSLLAAVCCLAEPALLPKPAKMEVKEGTFALNAKTAVVAPAELAEQAKILAADLRAATGFPIPVIQTAGAVPAIRLVLDPKLRIAGPEGCYRLAMRGDGVEIAAPAATGIFYGGRTLLQLLPAAEKGADIAIAGLAIEDQPRFAWRGVMLDCSRTFQSIDYLKKTIDRLAFYKMNVLHLHLTDDQGWRMEIKKHPVLTQKGASFSAKYNEPASHQGFYTQAELKELVKYAELRGVTIVPEIEMPGHSLEVLVCRPDLSCTGKIPDDIFPFGKGATTTPDVLCAGNDDTFKLMEEVLDEVIEVFPSTFIHIGGDEVPKVRWQACPKCQARIKAEGLKNEHELQSYFIRRIEKHITAKGRRLIGWSEIMEGGLAPKAAVMDWIGGAAEATKAGHDAVMSPTSHCYFDYPYGAISSQRAYSFDPVARLSPEQAGHVLGLQANFWSHIDREPALVDRQLFPRLLSLAERGWSPAACRDWNEFKPRLDAQLPRLAQMGISYRREPLGTWKKAQMAETYQPLTWDVSKQVTGPGRYRATFLYSGGSCRLGIEAVELLANGKPAAADRHRGVTGASNEANAYAFELKEFVPGAKYELRASARSEGGLDSNGEIMFEKE